MSNMNQAAAIQEGLDEQEVDGLMPDSDSKWLDLARDSHRESTDFVDGSLKKQWEKNMSHFHSKHAPGSKYYTDTYRYRSKIFRPKIRAAVRKHEAAAAAAYFATNDAVHITPEDDGNQQQVISAEINTEIVNYRLEHSIPWFMALIGAYQESMNIGAVVSYQHWSYKERKIKKPSGMQVLDEETGEFVDHMNEETVVDEDKPIIDLRPIENVRISPASDWIDPVNSSPYLIDMIPMYVVDIKQKMAAIDPKTGEPEWRQLTEGEIMSAAKQEYDSLRQQREGHDRRDSKDAYIGVTDFQLVWVHRNFIRIDGQHVVYYTLGTQFMLSDPKPMEEVYRRKTRPYVMGVSQIEAHRTHPSAMVELGEQLIHESNEIANARIDNLKLAINQRHYIRRGADIDFMALMRSAPGSGILMDDPSGDVRPEQVKDVTSSSYAEQERLDGDFGDIIGTFSTGAAAANRSRNGMTDTLGGSEMLSSDANKIEEYQLRVFNETWVEPVLNQLLDMVREFETDETVINVCGKKSKEARKAGVQKFDWRMMQGPSTLRVSVGFGATNPMKRIEKLSVALDTTLKFLPHMAGELDGGELVNEIFGAVGSDGSRFFKGLRDDEQEDPRVKQLMAQMQEMQKIIDTKQIEQQGKERIEDIKQRGKLEIERIKSELAYIDKQIAAESNEIARAELLLQQSALLHQQRVTEINLLQSERDEVKNSIERRMDLTQTGEDDSKAGLLARNQYGTVPYAEG